MPMIIGADLVRRARSEGFAVAAFNVFNLETVQAIIMAAELQAAPVIVQVSPGAVDHAGLDALGRLAMDLATRASIPVTVHLDHCRDLRLLERAIDLGFGSVMFDGSALSLEDNIRGTTRALEMAVRTGAAVEAELGVIGGWEAMDLDQARTGVTTPDAAAAFVRECPVDVLAPALGTLHRMPDESASLDVALVRSIAAAADRPLALHGGSGVRRTSLPAAIAAGVSKLNISSSVSRSLATGIRAHWSSHPDDTDGRRFLGAGRAEIVRMATSYLALTGSAGRATSDIPATDFLPAMELE